MLDDLTTDVASDDLRETLERHRQQTKTHVNRLEDIFDAIGVPVHKNELSPWCGSTERFGD